MFHLLIALITIFPAVAWAASTGVTFTGASANATASPPQLGACTDGVNCFCDLNGTGSWVCEDWEDAEFYENVSGSWYDDTGDTGNRGFNSLYRQRYGSTAAAYWTDGTPAAPKVGPTCSNGGGVCGAKEYCSAAQGGGLGSDCWDGNSGSAIDIQRSGDYDAEIGTLTLTGGWGVTADVGDGNTHFGYRTQNFGESSGITADNVSLGGNRTDIGVIMLLAYASNAGTSGLRGAQYKHEEWGGDDPIDIEYWMHGNINSTGTSKFPYHGYWYTDGQTACQTALDNATITVGSAECVGDFFWWYGGAWYTQSTHFPYGEWRCTRAWLRGMGTSDMRVTVWHGDTAVFEMTGFDGTALSNHFYSKTTFNNYANNAASMTATSFRYMDNFRVGSGEPPTCASLGFD